MPYPRKHLVKVNNHPVAQRYTNERVIEITAPDGTGLLLELRWDSETLVVNPYRCDDNVTVIGRTATPSIES